MRWPGFLWLCHVTSQKQAMSCLESQPCLLEISEDCVNCAVSLMTVLTVSQPCVSSGRGRVWLAMGNVGISVFWDSVSLCGSSWSGTFCVGHAGFELIDPLGSSSQTLGFTVCTILPDRNRNLKEACQMGTTPSWKSAFIASCWVCRPQSPRVCRTHGHHLSWIWGAKRATFSLLCFPLTSRAQSVLLVTTLTAAPQPVLCHPCLGHVC